ncbi:hypothetical protein [Sphingomonas sp. 3-13AW]|uniref:hypothetical protein n=1 Tax=Sphingomonas sp. 3-13AW TaxID=3050450 RepID=UPI003BB5BD63
MIGPFEINALRGQIEAANTYRDYIAGEGAPPDGQIQLLERIGAHLGMAAWLADHLAAANHLRVLPESSDSSPSGMSIELVRLLLPGMNVRMLEPTSGEGADGEEYAYAVGTIGEVSSVDTRPEPQGLAVTVIIGPQDGDQAIVNVFDEGDAWFPLELADPST